MTNMKTSILAFTLVALTGCGSLPQGKDVPFISAEAQAELARFEGRYKVVDARLNRPGVEAIELILVRGEPSLRLLKKDGKQISAVINADKCVVNTSIPAAIFLNCHDSGPARYKSPSFTIYKKEGEWMHRSGALLPQYEPMRVHAGNVLFTYNIDESYGLDRPISAARVAQ